MSDDLAFAAGGQPYCLLVREHMKILAGRQTAGDVERRVVEAGLVSRSLLHAGEDQRRARLVDEHAVGFIHDREMQAAQEQALTAPCKPSLENLIDEETRACAAWAQRKPIAQVIEHELLVGAVSHVARVGALPLLRLLSVFDQSDGETQRIVDGRQLLGVAAGEILIDRHNMDRAARECGGNCGQQRRQGLAFTGLHFRERAAHHGGAAEQLNVEMAHPDVAARRLARERKRERHLARVKAGGEQSHRAARRLARANDGPAD